MPRPRKWRRVCSLPETRIFGPLDRPASPDGAVVMTVDEYETIRLIDLDGYTQQACAEQMNVARTTVTGIYNSARSKIAAALVEGKTLAIEGGDYQVCDGTAESCGMGSCNRNRRQAGRGPGPAGGGRGRNRRPPR